MSKFRISDGNYAGFLRTPQNEIGTASLGVVGSPILNEAMAAQKYGYTPAVPPVSGVSARYVRVFRGVQDYSTFVGADGSLSEITVNSDSVNIALNKPMTGGNAVLVDGVASAYFETADVTVDLGSVQAIESIRLNRRNDIGCTSVYRLLGSLDGATWTALGRDVTFRDPFVDYQTVSFDPPTAYRYWTVDPVLGYGGYSGIGLYADRVTFGGHPDRTSPLNLAGPSTPQGVEIDLGSPTVVRGMRADVNQLYRALVLARNSLSEAKVPVFGMAIYGNPQNLNRNDFNIQ